jgi:hypothetical protein
MMSKKIVGPAPLLAKQLNSSTITLRVKHELEMRKLTTWKNIKLTKVKSYAGTAEIK